MAEDEAKPEETAVEEPEAKEPEVGEKRKAEEDAEGGDEAGEKEAKVEEKVWTPVKLGPKTFNSPDEMIKYFSWLLNAMTMNQDMNDYERMVVEACLRDAHPEAEKKIGCGIKSFQIRTHPEHDSRCYMVVRTDGTCEDFSYRKCVEKLFPGWEPPARKEKPERGGRGGRGLRVPHRRGRGPRRSRPPNAAQGRYRGRCRRGRSPLSYRGSSPCMGYRWRRGPVDRWMGRRRSR